MEFAEDNVMPKLAQPLIEVDEPSTLVASHVKELLGQLEDCANVRSFYTRVDEYLPNYIAETPELTGAGIVRRGFQDHESPR